MHHLPHRHILGLHQPHHSPPQLLRYAANPHCRTGTSHHPSNLTFADIPHVLQGGLGGGWASQPIVRIYWYAREMPRGAAAAAVTVAHSLTALSFCHACHMLAGADCWACSSSASFPASLGIPTWPISASASVDSAKPLRSPRPRKTRPARRRAASRPARRAPARSARSSPYARARRMWSSQRSNSAVTWAVCA